MIQSVKKIAEDIFKVVDQKLDTYKTYVVNAIKNYRVGSDQIVKDAITAPKIASNAIYTRHLTAESITAEKIQTEAIEGQHLTLSARQSITTANRNLLLDSTGLVESPNYLIAEYETAELLPSTQYTFVLEGYINAGQSIVVMFNDGTSGTDSSTFYSDGYAVIRTTTPASLDNTKVRFYNSPSASAVQAQIFWACMYKGFITSPPRDYTPSIEEVNSRITATEEELVSVINIANEKNTIFYQASEPLATGTGDIWYKTSVSPAAIYRWDSIQWVDITTTALASALSAAADAQSTADGKIRTYAQETAPAGLAAGDVGDLWVDTNDANKLYRWDGTNWVSVQDGLIASHTEAIAGLNSSLSGKTTIYYQTSQPTATATGDIWYDTDATPVTIKRWSGSAWIDITSDALSSALAAASDAQSTADGKIRTFAQATAPTEMVASDVGDLWVDTDDNNKLYRWNGSAWVSVQDTHNDSLVSSHSSAISSITSSLNAKTTIFYQTSQPTATATGDIWYDTDANPVKIYRWSGSAWTDITSTALASALTAAADAQATADGKIKTYAQTTAPTGMAASDVGDLWVDTDDSNKLYRYSGSAWVAVQDTHNDSTLASHASSISSLTTSLSAKTTIFYQTTTPTATATGDVWYDTDASPVKIYRWSGSAWTDITTATLNAALAAAATAQSTADGKIRTFAQTTAPTGMVAGDVGDLWIDTDDNNKLYRWSSTAWVSVQDGNIATLSSAITNLTSSLSTRTTIFYQTSQPTATATGDVWYDTDANPIVIRRWSGSAWIDITSTALAQALSAAADAQSTADGKIVTFAQASPPTATAVGDLWVDTDDNNKLYRWNGSSWAAARDTALDGTVASISSTLDGVNGTLTTLAKQVAYTGSLPPSVPTDYQGWINTGVIPPEYLRWTGNSANTARTYAASNSGTSVTITDLSNDYALDVTVKNIATQAGSGTPSPSNVRAISGKASVTAKRMGKNLLRTRETSATGNGITYTVNADGSRTITGTASAHTYFNITYDFISDGSTYCLSMYGTDDTHHGVDLVLSGISGMYVDASRGGWYAGVIAAGKYSVTVQVRILSGTTVGTTIYPQLEKASAATEYEPYTETDHTIAPAATLYGLTGYEDEIGNDGHVTRRSRYYAVTGDESTWYQSGTVGADGSKLYYIRFADAKLDASIQALCSHFAWGASSNLTTLTNGQFRAALVDGGTVYALYFATTVYTTLTAFKSWLAGLYSGGTPMQLLYALATPATATVAPVEINGADGTNTVTSDGASVAVDYTGSGWEVIGGKANALYASANMKFDVNGLEITQTTIDGIPVDCVHKIGADKDGYYKASTGEFIGGLSVINGELQVAASSLSDPRVSNDTSIKLKSYGTSNVALVFKKDSTDLLEINTSSGAGIVQSIASSNPVGFISSGTYGDSSITAADGIADLTAFNSDASVTNWVEVNSVDNRIYLSRSATVNSDMNKKANIQSIGGDSPDIIENLIMALNPRQYEYKVDMDAKGQSSARKMHYGFTAQEVKSAMDQCGISQWSAYSDENPDRIGLCYEEFIAPMVALLQIQQKRINELESRISNLETKS